MSQIRVVGYLGLNKVAMTKAIQANAELDLATSKSITDALLKQGHVEIEIGPRTSAIKLLSSLQEANANAELLDE